MHIEDHHGGANASKIYEVEKKFGIKLPESYVKLVSTKNGGYPVPDGFDIPAINDASSVDRFLEIGTGGELDVENVMPLLKGRIPFNMFPIAQDPGGNLVLIGVEGEGKGEVFFWDHEREQDNDPTGKCNISHISDSLEDFMNNLYFV